MESEKYQQMHPYCLAFPGLKIAENAFFSLVHFRLPVNELAIKHRVGLPVDEVGDIPVEGQSAGLHPERVAPRDACLGGRGEVGEEAGDLEHGPPLLLLLAVTRVRALLEYFCH